MNNLIAIVGRPNVGKSTLFNKIIGNRVAIVDNAPGVTRDRLYREATWAGHKFVVIDTGGIEMENRPFQEQIQVQARIAIEEAQVIIFVIDAKHGLTSDDEMVARILRKSKKPVLVAANMLEGNRTPDSTAYELGFDIFPVSALHGEGTGDLLDRALTFLPDESVISEHMRVAIIGRPNAGKSSLLNALAKTERAIVSPIPGTTRDPIDAEVKIGEELFTIVDTAGINKKSKLIESVEHYALARAHYAIEHANLVLMIIDAERDLAHFDAVVGGYAFAEQKPLIIVVNKWDLVRKATNTMVEFERKLRKEFKFLTWAPVLFLSAKTGERLPTLEATITRVVANMRQQIRTPLLNEVIFEVQAMQPAPPFQGGRIQVYFSRQVPGPVPTFALFVNNEKFLHFSYERFLENELRTRFDFAGTPIKLSFKSRDENREL